MDRLNSLELKLEARNKLSQLKNDMVVLKNICEPLLFSPLPSSRAASAFWARHAARGAPAMAAERLRRPVVILAAGALGALPGASPRPASAALIFFLCHSRCSRVLQAARHRRPCRAAGGLLWRPGPRMCAELALVSCLCRCTSNLPRTRRAAPVRMRAAARHGRPSHTSPLARGTCRVLPAAARAAPGPILPRVAESFAWLAAQLLPPADDAFRAKFLWGRRPMLAACAARLRDNSDMVRAGKGGGWGWFGLCPAGQKALSSLARNPRPAWRMACACLPPFLRGTAHLPTPLPFTCGAGVGGPGWRHRPQRGAHGWAAAFNLLSSFAHAWLPLWLPACTWAALAICILGLRCACRGAGSPAVPWPLPLGKRPLPPTAAAAARAHAGCVPQQRRPQPLAGAGDYCDLSKFKHIYVVDLCKSLCEQASAKHACGGRPPAAMHVDRLAWGGRWAEGGREGGAPRLRLPTQIARGPPGVPPPHAAPCSSPLNTPASPPNVG